MFSKKPSDRDPGAMAPTAPWLTQLSALWRQHNLMLTQVLDG